MEKNLRSKRNQPIIEISESDDEDCKILSEVKDESYTIEEDKTKKKITRRKKEPANNRKQKSTRVTNVRSTKRKDQEESSETFTSKKQKLEEPSVSDSKTFQQNQKDIKFDTKPDVKIKENPSFSQCIEWTDVDYISEINNVDRYIAENVIRLFKEDNTIPFIARYRKNMTGSMEPDQLRALKDSFEQVKMIKHRAANIIKSIDKLGKWSPEVHSAVTSAKSLADLEHIYSLYKPSSKRTLAERARELGLGSISDAVLRGQRIPPLVSLIDTRKKGLQSEEQVRDGIVHIIADVISKDKEVFDKVMLLRKIYNIDIQTTQCSASENTKNENEIQKYKSYFSFKSSERNIKPHQTLAINRAESQKIVNAKVVVPDVLERAFKNYCFSRYVHRRDSGGNSIGLREDLLRTSIDYAYKKLIKPLVVRRVRSEMKEKAEAASIEVFAINVKQLLLTPPVRGKVVLGIDPGFYHGCKLAVVSEHGDVLETAVIKPNTKQSEAFQRSAETLQKLMKRHNCTVISLGNGTASRETEMFLTRMIRSKIFGSLDVKYTIVDEAGASIYSCGSEAKSEFPDLDPNLISAVSIARRLQDPLAELVKVEPKHLGVGQYQHDLPEKQLLTALDEVVTEAVSFVGVDINTASHCLLRRVAGLTNSRAASIIEWRVKHGAFKNRMQLLDVKGIGGKTFEQCAGFVRILPETAVTSEVPAKRGKASKNNDLNPLDQTWIHPESYATANNFVDRCECKLDDLGTPAFIEKINFHAKTGYAALAAHFGTNEATMEVVVKALTMRKNEDIRLASNYPLFRDGMKSIKDLSAGTVLNGVVRNVTHFGAFVDVGVGDQGLIHVTRMKKQTLQVSQRVEVKVIEVDAARKRIGLELMTTL